MSILSVKYNIVILGVLLGFTLSSCTSSLRDGNNGTVSFDPSQIKKQAPVNCKDANDLDSKLQEFEGLLHNRRELLNEGKANFCQVNDQLQQNQSDIKRVIQEIEPNRQKCEAIQSRYDELSAEKVTLDEKAKRLSLSRFCPRECPAIGGVVSTFEIDNDGPALIRHQANSQQGFTTKNVVDLNVQTGGKKYFWHFIPQMRRSPNIFLVGQPTDKNNSLLFQTYCRFDEKLASSISIPFSEIGVAHKRNIEPNPRVSASLGTKGFALRIASTKILLWLTIEQKYKIISADKPVLAISLGRERGKPLRLIYLDNEGNVNSKIGENPSILLGKVDLSGVDNSFLRLIDRGDIVYVLTSQNGYLFWPKKAGRRESLGGLAQNKRIIGMASFRYRSDSSYKNKDFGLGFVVCDNTGGYQINLHRIRDHEQIGDPKSLPIPKLFDSVSCKELTEGVQFFVRSDDVNGEAFSFVLVWNHPNKEAGQVNRFKAEKDSANPQSWSIKTDNFAFSETIDFSLVRVVGDFYDVRRIYHFLTNATFNIGFDK
jgi:hypothetical protein